MDKLSTILNYGQRPIVKSKYGEFINHEENALSNATIKLRQEFTFQ